MLLFCHQPTSLPAAKLVIIITLSSVTPKNSGIILYLLSQQMERMKRQSRGGGKKSRYASLCSDGTCLVLVYVGSANICITYVRSLQSRSVRGVFFPPRVGGSSFTGIKSCIPVGTDKRREPRKRWKSER